MATLRTHVRISRPADEVWNVVSDAGSIADWFPALASSSATATTRHCDLVGGGSLDEEIVTNDEHLRRFQYRITDGLPVQDHLGTVDVLDDPDGTLVIYSTEITPEELADQVGPLIEDGVAGLKQHLENPDQQPS
ncbi:MAG: SRPBCC family protein [Pseudonocardiaceae bacterium]